MMNSFATIYFHNYLRLDEMPVPVTISQVKSSALKDQDLNSSTEMNSNGVEKFSSIEDPPDTRIGMLKNERVNTIVTIDVKGKEYRNGKIYLELKALIRSNYFPSINFFT